MYALKQNQGDPEGVQRVLSSIVPHLYGIHQKCDARWCHHIDNPGELNPIIIMLNDLIIHPHWFVIFKIVDL